jgi:hypothetical protein
VRYCILFESSNRQKKIADCTVCTDADVEGPYDDVAGSYTDVVGLSWRTVGSWMIESFLDTWHLGGEWIGDTWPKQGLPRVTWALDKICVVDRTRPRDLRAGEELWEGPPNRACPPSVLNYYMVANIFKLTLCYVLGAVRAGAKPRPPTTCGLPYNHQMRTCKFKQSQLVVVLLYI